MSIITMTELHTEDLSASELKEKIKQMSSNELRRSLLYYDEFFNATNIPPQRKYEVYKTGIAALLIDELTKHTVRSFKIDEKQTIRSQIFTLLQQEGIKQEEKNELEKLLINCESEMALQEKEKQEILNLPLKSVRYLFAQAFQPIYNCIEEYETKLPKNNMHAFFIKNWNPLARFHAYNIIQKTREFLTHYPFENIFAGNNEWSQKIEKTRYTYHTEGSNKCDKADLLKRLSWLESDLLERKDTISLAEFQFLIAFFRSIEHDLANTLERHVHRRPIA